jgi:hypothetical protein
MSSWGCGSLVLLHPFLMPTKLKVPTSTAGQFLLFAIIELVACFLIVFNTRAVSKGSYMWTGVSDFAFSLSQFTVFKLVVDDPNGRTWASGLGGAVGATAGALLSLWFNQQILGQ